jgi:CBS domain-containing protein
MAQIADILKEKKTGVLTVEPSATVFDAIKKMVDANVGSLLVMEGGKLLGIVTERDYLRRVALEGRTSKTTRVSEIMTERLAYVEPSADVETCMAVMSEKRVRHLPVVQRGDLVGIVSIGDLVKHLSREQKVHIQYLTDYITGKYPA